MVDSATEEWADVAPAAAAGSKRRRQPGAISTPRLLAFSSPAIPLMGAIIPVSFLLAPFYTGELGMSLTTWGLVLLVSRLFDIAVDPFIGIACDRFGSRWGRRRHWLVLATPIVMIGAALLFMPQVFTARPGFAFATLATIVLHFGYTVYSLNHTAWGGELSDDYHERTRIMGWRGVLDGVAPLLALGAAATMEWIDPATSNAQKVAVAGWLAIGLLPVMTVVALASTGERPVARSAARQKVKLWAGLKLLLANRVLLRLLGVLMLHIAPMAVMTAVNIFYVSFVLEAPGLGASLLMVAFTCALISVPLWMRIAKGREKHRVLALSYLANAVIMSGFLFLGAGDVWLFLGLTMLTGLCNGTSFLIRSILTDVVETDAAQAGGPRTGTFFAVLETVAKLGPTLVMAGLFPLLELFGFDPTGRHNTPQSIDVVRYAFSLAPTLPMLAAAALLWRFPLGSKELAALREQRAAQAGPPTAAAN